MTDKELAEWDKLNNEGTHGPYEFWGPRGVLRMQSLIATIRDQKALLREVEWEGDQAGNSCPACRTAFSHRPDCRLAAAIREE